MMALPTTWPENVVLAPVVGDKSPLTTPPVTLCNDHVAEGLPTKFPLASRVMAQTVIEVPEVTFAVPDTVPLPSAAVSTCVCVAVPAENTMFPLVTAVKLAPPDAVAVNVIVSDLE